MFFAGCRATARPFLYLHSNVLVLYQCSFDEAEAICLRAVEREQGWGPAFISLLSAACLSFFCGEKISGKKIPRTRPEASWPPIDVFSFSRPLDFSSLLILLLFFGWGKHRRKNLKKKDLDSFVLPVFLFVLGKKFT